MYIFYISIYITNWQTQDISKVSWCLKVFCMFLHLSTMRISNGYKVLANIGTATKSECCQIAKTMLMINYNR